MYSKKEKENKELEEDIYEIFIDRHQKIKEYNYQTEVLNKIISYINKNIRSKKKKGEHWYVFNQQDVNYILERITNRTYLKISPVKGFEKCFNIMLHSVESIKNM